MQEISLQEIDQVSGGIIFKWIARAALSWSVEQALQGKVDHSGYLRDNPNYWYGA